MSVHVTNSSTVESETEPLTHARILYQNIARDADLAVSSEADDYPGVAAQNDNTFEAWKATAVPATWRIDRGTGELPFNACGVYGDFNGCSLRVQYSDNDVDWSNASDLATPTGRAALLLFPQQTAEYVRLLVSGAIPTLAHIRFGMALAMQRAVYRGLTPITMGRQTVVRPNVSERGQWLGRSVIRSGLRASIQWERLTADWVRDNFDPFIEDAREHPFFIAWRPETFPNEVAYVAVDQDIRPQNTGPRNFMSVGFEMMGAASG